MSLSLDRRTMLGGILALPAIIRPGLLMPISARGARMGVGPAAEDDIWHIVPGATSQIDGQEVLLLANPCTGARRTLRFTIVPAVWSYREHESLLLSAPLTEA